MLLAALCFPFLLQIGHSARILGIFHVPSKSHHILGSALLKSLAEKGHDVTMISPYPFKTPTDNYRDIFLEEMLHLKEAQIQFMMVHNLTTAERFAHGRTLFSNMADIVLSHPEVKNLKNENFDLIIQFAMYSDSLLGLAHHLNAPVILFSTIGSTSQIDQIFGNSGLSSFVPNLFYGYSDEMSFIQRVVNTLVSWVFYGLDFYQELQQREILSKHFPDAPSLEVLRERVALAFINTHFSFETPRPFVPNIIQIGGFHVQEAGKLPDDLAKFLDEAADGVVFFSLGSNVKISKLPSETVEAIIKVLGRLKMKVLFKTEQEIGDLPANIKTGRWFPQNDILGHPNVRLFISHGGMLSTIEALYHGVLVVGLPVFGDQQANIEGAVERGYVLKLNINEVNEENFSSIIAEILSNPKYSDNVKLRSSLLREQPIKPLDKAIYWVEHVIKHKGAKHLKNAGTKLAFYQYFLLDVIAFLAIVLLLTLVVIYLSIKKFYNAIKIRLRRLKLKNE